MALNILVDNYNNNIIIIIFIQDEGTLVYTDIGQRPPPTKLKINTLLLDDNRVEYALLDHFAYEQKAQESSAATRRGKCKPIVHTHVHDCGFCGANNMDTDLIIVSLTIDALLFCGY